MAIIEKPKAPEAAPQAPPPRPAAQPVPLPLYVGRTTRVVGPQQNVNPQDMPHARNARGELGKALFHWCHNQPSKDPLGRIAMGIHAADGRNVVTDAFGKGKGKVNPHKTPVSDPAVMAQHIKRVAKFMGADAVGIAPVDPAYLYVGNLSDYGTADDDRGDPAIQAKRYPYAIVCAVAWDYEMGKAHRHRIGDAAYHFSQQWSNILLQNLSAYIRELGYSAVQRGAAPMPMAVLAGLGEVGRNGMLITEKFGARVHLPDVILTDLPLATDKPIDIGVEEFCGECRKCASTCPTNSIPMGDKVVHNGVEKYKVNWETCYRLRPYVHEYWEICLTCVTVCPYTKPNVWWRTLAVKALATTPPSLRLPLVKTLKWLDDRIWGVIPRERVKWLGYDTGVQPGEKACTIAGCNAHGEEAAATKDNNIGYYPPMRENTRRFEAQQQRAKEGRLKQR